MARKPLAEWIAPSEYAKYRGVSLATVKDWVDDGKLDNCWKVANNNRKKINWRSADVALDNAQAGSNGANSIEENFSDPKIEHSSPGGTLTRARTAKTAMEAQAAKLKFELLSGSLVKKDDVIKVAKDMGRLTKESLLTLPDRLSPVLTGINDMDEIHRILTEEINTALRNLATSNYEFFEDDDNGNI